VGIPCKVQLVSLWLESTRLRLLWWGIVRDVSKYRGQFNTGSFVTASVMFFFFRRHLAFWFQKNIGAAKPNPYVWYLKKKKKKKKLSGHLTTISFYDYQSVLFWVLGGRDVILLMLVFYWSSWVPHFTYFFGKRWVLFLGLWLRRLAETLGDPFRQLSDKVWKAWKSERVYLMGVLSGGGCDDNSDYANYFQVLVSWDATNSLHSFYGLQ